MKSKWSKLLEMKKLYRILWAASLLSLLYVGPLENNREWMQLLNMVTLLFSALSFRNVYQQALSTILLTCIDSSFIPFAISWHMILFKWVGSFAFASFVMMMISKYQNEKQNIVDLVSSLAKALDSRDPYTAYHSRNVARYSRDIALELKLPPTVCNHIYAGGLLHDIGKIGVSEAILNKNSRLSNEEFTYIKQHPVIGYNLVKHIKTFERNGILNMIQFHHEKYDGTGYPLGLHGETIPLEARIMAVADAFDAMTSHRVYREAIRLEETKNELQAQRGRQFDPQVVDAFLRVLEKKDYLPTPMHQQQEIVS